MSATTRIDRIAIGDCLRRSAARRPDRIQKNLLRERYSTLYDDAAA